MSTRLPVTNEQIHEWSRDIDPRTRRAVQGLFYGALISFGLWCAIGLIVLGMARL